MIKMHDIQALVDRSKYVKRILEVFHFSENVNLCAVSKGPNAETTLFLLLTWHSEGQDFLIQLLGKQSDLFSQVNLNASSTADFSAGKTAFWFLAGTPQGRVFLTQLFEKFPALFSQVNLNAAFTADFLGSFAKITAFWFLAANPEGRVFLPRLLRKYPSLFQQINLNEAPSEGSDAGKTAFWFLAANSEGQDFLIQLLGKWPDLFSQVNLNASSTADFSAGKTAFWFLAANPKGRVFLTQLFGKYSALFSQVNLNEAPSEGSDAGKTAFWFLASDSQGRSLLTQLFEKSPALFSQLNLSTAPTTGSFVGTTAFFFLAKEQEGQALLMKYPELLLNDHLDINNKTLWEYWSISGFEETLILLGADIRLAPSTEIERLVTLQRSIFLTLDEAISEHWCNEPTEAAKKTAFKQFIESHPELASLEPIFEQLVARRINSMLGNESIFEFMAKESARRWLLNNIELIKDMKLLADESFRSVEQTVLRCLREESQKPNFPKHIEKELEAEIVKQIASYSLKEMDEAKVRKAICETVSQWNRDSKHHFSTNAFFGKGARLNESSSMEIPEAKDLNALRAKRLEFLAKQVTLKRTASEVALPENDRPAKQIKK